MTSTRRALLTRRRLTWLISLLLVIVTTGAMGLLLVGMRSNRIEDESIKIGNMASLLAEQVEHAMKSLDTSLRVTVRILHDATPENFQTRVEDSAFIDSLNIERKSLEHASLFAITDSEGKILAGSLGFTARGIDVGDRPYFQKLRNDPRAGLVVAAPVKSRLNGHTLVIMARRIASVDGTFLGIVFIGAEPGGLVETSNAITQIPGQSFALFTRDGALLYRRPTSAARNEIGQRIEIPDWYESVKNGGGIYRSPGWFDSDPKYVAVRNVPQFDFVATVALAEDAMLATWRRRAWGTGIGGLIAIAIIVALINAQLYLRDRLARARMRSWMRGRRLTAKSSELAGVNRRFGLTLDYMSHGMAMFNVDHVLVVANRAYAELYDLNPNEIRPGMKVAEIFEKRIAAGSYVANPDLYRRYALRPPFADRIDHLVSGRIVLVRTKRMDDGGWVTMHEDVTERAKSSERLAHMALHDSLTQLPNRAAFRKHLLERTQIDRASDLKEAVLLVDLDGFKNINDTYGHDVGDKVLVEVAARLYRAVGDRFLARLGGDEFVIMGAEQHCDETWIADFSTKLREEVARPILLEGRRISLTLTVGAVLLGAEDRELVNVLRRADLALLDAKRQGRARCRIFDAELERRYDERVTMARDLREAIEHDALDVYYQPIVNAHDRATIAVEALARWRHPEVGMISPGLFIPIAEESGLIGQLGMLVLRRACVDAARWPAHVQVAVNVSSLQLMQPGFADRVSDVLASTGLAPSRLQIEITESVLLERDRSTLEELRRLHTLGVTFALDDFGTGYASLANLKVVPLDKVKIDKCFVDDICDDRQSVAIVGAVVALARGLGIVVTAEGVETEAQATALSALGVGTMQGYLFGRPAPVAEQGSPGSGARAA